MQVTSFFDVMIRPMPAEISQVKVPAFVRSGAWAMDGTGDAIAATTPKAARALRRFFMSQLPF
jgi:hypothetical protein